jgi:cyanophycinase-like exopeptidase
MRDRRAVLAWLLLAACLPGRAEKVSNIIIGGGMQHCGSIGATLDVHDPRCTASWRDILAADPAFAGVSAAQVQFGALPAVPQDGRRALRSLAYTADQGTVAIYRTMVAAAAALAGGARPTIGLVTAAAQDPLRDYELYASALRSAGATVLWLPLDGALRRALDGADCAALAPQGDVAELAARQRLLCADNGAALDAALASLHGVSFTGGNQARHRDSLISNGRSSTQLAILQRRFAAGELVVAGSSAGNAVQAGGIWQGRDVPMIMGGHPVGALLGGFQATPQQQRGAQDGGKGSYHPAGGLGFFRFGPLDSHFSERGREARLVRLAADTAMQYAFGVDENTALLVERPDASGATRMRVAGARGVWVADLRAAKTDARAGGAFAIDAVQVHYLHEGDSLQIDGAGRLQVQLRERTGIAAGARGGLRLAAQQLALGAGQAGVVLGACPAGAMATLQRSTASRLAADAQGQLSYSALSLALAACPPAAQLAMREGMPHNVPARFPAPLTD